MQAGHLYDLADKLWQVSSLKMVFLLSRHILFVSPSQLLVEEGGRVERGQMASTIHLTLQLCKVHFVASMILWVSFYFCVFLLVLYAPCKQSKYVLPLTES